MKSLKKLLSIFAAFMMVVGLTMTNASAASITIDNAQSDKEYKAYKLFSVDSSTQSVYTASQAERDKFYSNGELISGSPFNFEENKVTSTEINKVYNVTPAKKSDGSEFTAEEIVSFIKGHPQVLGTAIPGTYTNGQVTFVNLSDGYYYITSTTGTVVSLYNAGDITVKDKNDIEFKKESKNETKVDHQVGDTVPFKISFTAYEGWENVVISDEMTKGLAYVKSGSNPVDVKVKINSNVIDSTKYTLTSKNPVSTGYASGFELKFENFNDIEPINRTYNIEITYNATVTSDAVFEQVSENSATLKKDNDTNLDHKEVEVYNWDLTLNKVDGNDKSALAGAKFNIYRTVTGANEEKTEELVKFITKTEEENGESKTVYVADKNGSSSDLVTPENGKIEIRGLDNVEYVIKEIEAPSGYNLLTESIKFTPGSKDENGTIVVEKEIINNKGSQLPETGGMGTTMLYVVGGILMVGAAILFVTNKRMKHN